MQGIDHDRPSHPGQSCRQRWVLPSLSSHEAFGSVSLLKEHISVRRRQSPSLCLVVLYGGRRCEPGMINANNCGARAYRTDRKDHGGHSSAPRRCYPSRDELDGRRRNLSRRSSGGCREHGQ
jgi:hypothetical protein